MDERAIAHVDPPFAAGRDRDAQLDQQGGFRPRRDPALTADAREGGADCARSSSAAQAGVSTEAPVAFVAIIARCGRRAPATRFASHAPSQGDGAAVRIDADVLQVMLARFRGHFPLGGEGSTNGQKTPSHLPTGISA